MARRRRRTSIAGSPILLVAFIILFVLATGGAVMFHNHAAKLEDDIATLKRINANRKEKLVVADREIKDWKQFTGMADLRDPRANDRNPPDYDGRMKPGLDYLQKTRNDLQVEVDQTLQALAQLTETRSASPGVSTSATVVDLIRFQAAKVGELQGVIARVERERKTIAARERQSKREDETEIGHLKKSVARRGQDVAETEKTAREEKGQLQQEVDQVKLDLTKARAELPRERDKHMVRELRSKDEIRRLKERLTKLQDRPFARYDVQTAPRVAIVLNTDLEGKDVWIDLARPDGARRGLRFTVYHVAPNGEREPRAIVEVSQAGDEISRAGVRKTLSDRPILKGDILLSPVFERGRKKIFALDDTFAPAEVNSIRATLSRHGHVIVDPLHIRTDFLIVKANEQGKVFQQAKLYSVPALRVDRLREMLGQ